MRAIPAIGGLCILLYAAAGFAESKQGGAVKLAESQFNGGLLVETGLGLLLVLGVIFALAWLLRKFGRLPMQGKGAVEIIGGVSLGPRERAVLLKVGGTRLLVGVAPGQVQKLHVLDEDEVLPEAGEEGGFAQRLKTQMEAQKS
ncbi:flagellar biosynthetic protein FliO [Solemya velesiana gill symbiont]|uniref:Flagellar protein n=1 Tax=Solemya velesiana gill symbiont TaxID=1918948 RepID=A0A1T2KWL8_9GAMM|nr:flagellar biosynthetic protein FliO [Solemya velesiana gill symbiont]OOZ37233.1 flagellar biosynthetic protein FliO [Solemya velesiana gill symbiont]